MKKTVIWVLSIVLAVSSMIYQRSTGPTYKYKGQLEHAGKNYKYGLLRSQETTEGAQITLPTIEDAEYTAKLHYKRYKTKDAVTSVEFKLNTDNQFVAQLPVQPSAGKIEYVISGAIDGEEFNIPAKGEDNIVLRYKDPVSSYILIPHVSMMVLGIFFGILAGLCALFDHGSMRRWTVVTFAAMTLGGMLLGPLVQKSAFGEYWTGFPNGGDFTDNKTLIMWLAWVVALAIILFIPKIKETIGRAAVISAAVVMVVVYMIPHSLGGSTLDYDKVDRGIDPKEAINNGAEE